MNDLSERIQQIRRALKLTQQGLGRLAGVSKSAVSQWERGITEPQRDALLAMQKNAGINPEWIVRGAGSMRIGQEPLTGEASPSSEAFSPFTLTAEEWELLVCYRRAQATGKEIVRAVARIVGNDDSPPSEKPSHYHSRTK